MNLRLSLPRFAAVPAAAAAALLLAACGGGTAETPEPAAPTAAGTSSGATNRQASSSDWALLPITVNNNSNVDVQVKTFNIDPSDWEAGGHPDQFNNVNLGVNTWTRATVHLTDMRNIYPFGLQFWKLDGNRPVELLAEIELEAMNRYHRQCGLTLRGDSGAIPCDASRGFVQKGYVIQVSNMGNNSDIRFANA